MYYEFEKEIGIFLLWNAAFEDAEWSTNVDRFMVPDQYCVYHINFSI